MTLTDNLETELSDGSFRCTSNAPTVEVFDYGERVVSRRVDSPDVEQLLRAHAQSVDERMQSDPTIETTRCHTPADFRSFADRLQLAKSNYRRARVVPMTEAELNGASDGRYAPEAAAIARELESSSKRGSK